MRVVLVRKTDKAGIVQTCIGIDLAEVLPAPKSHPVGIETNLVDDNILRRLYLKKPDSGESYEFLEGPRHLVVAHSTEPGIVPLGGPENNLALVAHPIPFTD